VPALRFRLKILDRYILRQFLSTYAFVVLILVSVLIVIDIVEKNGDFIRTTPGFYNILIYYLNFMPYWANLLSPITVFIATIIVTARL
jgi:lipopolysaccharide export system permease protein